jgi:hypothetical protein
MLFPPRSAFPQRPFTGRGSDSKVSDKTWRKLEEAETRAGIRRRLGQPSATASSPERKAIEARFKAWLDAAERIEGGLGFAAVTVRLHCRPEDLLGLDPEAEAAADRLIEAARADASAPRVDGDVEETA